MHLLKVFQQNLEQNALVIRDAVCYGLPSLLPCCLVVMPPGTQGITGFDIMQTFGIARTAFSQALMREAKLQQGSNHANTHRQQPANHGAQHGSIMSHHVSLICCQ